MIGYIVARRFTVSDYVNEPEHREALESLTDAIMDYLLDRENANSVISDSGVSVNFKHGVVTLDLAVKTADEGAADAIAMREFRDALEVVGVTLHGAMQSAEPTRQVQLV